LKKIIFILILLSLAGGGYYLYNGSNLSVGNFNPFDNSKKIHLFLPEFEDAPDSDSEVVAMEQTPNNLDNLASKFSPPGYSTTIENYIAPLVDSINLLKTYSNDIILGVTHYSMYEKISREHLPLEALLALSSDLKKECTIEVGLIVQEKSGFKSIADLNDKNLATAIGTTALTVFLFPKYEEANIKFQKTNVNVVFPWLISQLDENNVHVASTQMINFGDKKIAKFFGPIIDNKLKFFPHLTLLDSVDTKIPCYVLFINKNAPAQAKSEIKKTIMENFSNVGLRKKVKSKIPYIGNFYPLKGEEEINAFLEKYRDKRYRNYSKSVLEGER